MGDVERLVSKAAVGRINPRELQQLRLALESIALIKRACEHADNEQMRAFGTALDACEALHELIAKSLVPDPPLLLNRGHVIAAGVDAELDELRSISASGKDYLQQIRDREAAATGITSLKISFNNVFGYYIEVRNTYKDQVPADWIRKQTLVNAERYITQELKDYEEKILGAEDKIAIIETRIFNELIEKTKQFIAPLQLDASTLAALDCLYAFSVVAREHNYIRPSVDESTTLDIRGHRNAAAARRILRPQRC